MLVLLISWPVYCVWCVSHNNGKNNKEKINSNIQHNLNSCWIHFQDLASHANIIFYLKKLSGDVFANASTNVNLWAQHFSSQDKVVNTSSKRIFDGVIPSGTVYPDCHSPNVIYLIAGSSFSLQYVREIGQKRN